ncbi:MAG: hypothetical protein HOV68_25840 [Streptomycetaceae bacterium]|nr:hypothetical protein [Streptomycetaceae bacterium]
MIGDRVHGPVLVDWAHACLGPAWADLTTLAPQLVLAGHTAPDIADLLIAHHLTAGNLEGAQALLAGLTGHWERASRQPEIARAPGLRAYQHRAAAAGRAILAVLLS